MSAVSTRLGLVDLMSSLKCNEARPSGPHRQLRWAVIARRCVDTMDANPKVVGAQMPIKAGID